MSEEKRKLPVGIENFEQIFKDDFYYVDKTGLISELLRNWGMVSVKNIWESIQSFRYH